MDLMIWVVSIALGGYVVYAILTAPPSSGCLSADLARARDEERKREAARSARRTPDPRPVPEPAAELTAAAPPAASAERVSAPAAEPAPAPVAAPDEASSVGAPADAMKNPLTGETAAAPTNYRFAKRWIKEALVAEGLLEKVYAAAELGPDNAEKVRVALARFKQLEKYRG